MRIRPSTAIGTLVAVLVAVAVAACGSSSSSSSSTAKIPLKPGENPLTESLTGGKRGGTLTVYSQEDFEHLDPGEAYFVLDYAAMFVTQRPLFVFMPNAANTLAPDLATAVPTTANGGITDGGKTVTVHIQPDVHYAPPVNRAVTSQDVAFAIERGANPNVVNPYFPTYFGSGSPSPLVGAQSPKYTGGPIPGIQTPNKTTIVFHMTKPGATTLIQALSLPTSAPVPPEFVKPLDAHSPTTFGTTYLTATGPYMFKENTKTGQFAGIGYQTGKSAVLVRNPNWNPNTYAGPYKPPAYLDQINFSIGGDTTVIGQQVLKGSDSVQLDTPSNTIVQLAYQSYPSQITFTQGSGDHYVAVDNATGPFANINLRKAFWAQLDREAIVKARGGSIVAQPMTHFLYPGDGGFQQAGGDAGPQVDYNTSVTGNHTVACKYMKLAGYPSCKYTGSHVVRIVSSNGGNVPAITQIVNSALSALGFKTSVSEVNQATMYAKYCGVPKLNIDACPAQGWVRDFADPLATLYATFNGASITPSGNPNQGQVNVSAINKAMESAALIVNPTQRDDAWAKVDEMLVDEAAAVPEEYDNQPNIHSKDVKAVDDVWNIGTWDLSYTSLDNP